MLSLSVEFDTYLVDRLIKGKKMPTKKDWINLCKKYNVNSIIDYPLFSFDEKVIDSCEINLFQNYLKYLKGRLEKSVDHISNFFPNIPNRNIKHNLTVCFIPYGKTNFGPKPSVQFFSIYPDANPYEIYLFLIHIYYHEITFINYTDYCKECSVNPDTPEKLKYFILSLIQNEGIGNFAILKELTKFRKENPSYKFKYFTYANQLGNKKKVAQSMSLLKQIFNEMNSSNFLNYRKKINLILKNKKLPIINLVGTHMAKCIEEYYGVKYLKNVYKKSANSFFKLYLNTDDPLKKYLLGTNVDLNNFL